MIISNFLYMTTSTVNLNSQELDRLLFALESSKNAQDVELRSKLKNIAITLHASV